MNFDKLFQTQRLLDLTLRPHSSESYYELIAKLLVQFDLENDSYELVLDGSLQAICAKFPDVTKEEDLKAANLK
jgi:cyclopropane fatty-acyl-phospholipid synthase-like methyltransferase